MSSKIFAGQGDFSSRTSETIFFLDGEVYYARPSSKEFHLDLMDFPEVSKVIHKTVHVDDERLFLGGARLGLFNASGGVYLPVRTPARRYRYGTPPEFITNNPVGRNKTRVNAFNNGFKAMLKNQYPSVTEAVQAIRESKGQAEVAISRHFWLRENQLGLLTLMFKDSGPVFWMANNGEINFVEKTKLSRYLTPCSRSLTKIIEELRSHAV